MGISIGNRLLGTTGLSPGGGLSRGGGLSFGGFTTSLALNLNFLSGVLDPRITFSRPSLATYFDSTGKLTYAPNNIALQSNAFSSATWSKINAGTGTAPVLTSGQIDPDGGTTAWRLQANSGGGTGPTDYSVMRQALATSNIGIRSIWIKSNTGVNQVVYFGTPTVGALVTATPTWTRVSFKPTVSSVIFDIGSYPNVPGGGTASVDVLIWQAQCEEVTYQTTPSTYVATTASAYYGPRFEYNPNTLVPQGLLIEEAMAANLLTYSQDFRDTATAGSTRPWTWGNATAAITTATNSPEGVQNAYKLAENLANGTHAINNLAGTVGAQETFSFYAKAAERSWCIAQMGSGGVVYYNISSGVLGTVSGATATITSVGGGWYRCTITATRTTNQNNLIYASTGDGVASYQGVTGSGIYIYGAQLEARAFATSYLPTGASTAARSADVASMSGTNFTSWFSAAQGTFAASFDFVGNADGANPRRIFQVQSDGVYATGYFSLHYQSGRRSLVNTSSSSGANTTVDWILTTTANISERVALSYDSSGLAFSYAGVSALTSATVFAGGANSTYFTIGNTNNLSQFLNGHIAYIRYYNLRLPNADLQALTSPPLTPSMLMTFDTSSNSYIVSNWWS